MKISIVMPAYNAGACIATALRAVQNQTYRNWELLVVDDCSSDDTRAVVQRWAERDNRIRLLAQARNGGPSVARNTGFDAACGDWIALLDADDSWDEDRLERFLPYLKSDQYDLVCDRLALYNAAQDRVVAASWPWARREQPLGPLELLKWDMPGQRAPLGWAKPLFRRTWLDRNALRYQPALRFGEDWRLLMDCVMAGARAVLLPFAAYRYTMRLAEKNFSQTRVDFVSPYTLHSEIQQQYGRRWSLRTRLAARLRGWLIGGLEAKARLKPAYHARRWLDLATLLMTSPRCWGILLIHQVEKLVWYR